MPQNILDHLLRGFHTGGRVGVREDHAPVLLIIVLRHDVKILIQRLRLIGNPEHVCPDIIKRIGNIGKQDRFSTVKKGQETHGQHIIRTDPRKHLLRFQPLAVGNGLHQFRGCRIRIPAQQIRIQAAQRLHHPRRRRIRVLVGIQFDHFCLLRLLAGRIRRHTADIFFPGFHFMSLPYASFSVTVHSVHSNHFLSKR